MRLIVHRLQTDLTCRHSRLMENKMHSARSEAVQKGGRFAFD